MTRKSLLFIFLLIQSLWLVAQEGLTPTDIAKLESVSDVLISDDGDWIAYTLRVQADPLKENKPASYQLYLYQPETEQTVPFVTRGSVRSVAFRPQHQTITFLDRREGDKGTTLYEISMKGGESQAIYSFETSISDYQWSPDGQHLAFIAKKPGEAEKSDLPYEPEVYEENLTFSRAYLFDMEQEELKAINLEGNASALAWSPNGKRLAIAQAPTPLVDDYYMKQTVHIVDAQTQNEIGKVDHSAKLGDFAFSPDGEHLAMIAGADLNDPIAGRLFVVDADGGKPVNLQPDYEGMFEALEWSDNNEIQFLASQGVWSVFGSIMQDGSAMKTFIDEDGPVLTSFDWAEGDHYAFVAETPQHPSEVYLINKESGNLERVTHHNAWLSDRQLANQEVITYKTDDDQNIQGILIHPLSKKDGQRYPLITVVHGGPESHYDNGWLSSYSSPGQVAAAGGYAVFYPNYRGSTGRGEAFAKSSQGDLAGKEFDDVVEGVDYLIEMGLVDKDKVGVTGGSYGGYATGWLSTKYTDRFAAGVMFVGISNNISKWGTSDIPEELFLVHARKRIWDDYEFFLKRSPVYYADQAKTPLLIMAGKEDTRVHPSQSIELYRHIKTRTDTPVRLVLYPGEGHGNRNATARFDYSLRMMRWFDQYLKSEDTEMKPAVEVKTMRR